MLKSNPLEKLGYIKLPVRQTGGGIVYALVDDDYDGEYFSQFRWHLNKDGRVFRWEYSPNEVEPYTGVPIKATHGHRRSVYLHREVTSAPDGIWVQHIDGSYLNNRSSNLKLLTPGEIIAIREQNNPLTAFRNKNPDSPSFSVYRGVSKNSSVYKGKKYISKGWYAIIRKKYIGYFPTQEAAARAYDQEARKLWGDKAVLNFPEEP